jgi:hypothetical protein
MSLMVKPRYSTAIFLLVAGDRNIHDLAIRNAPALFSLMETVIRASF